MVRIENTGLRQPTANYNPSLATCAVWKLVVLSAVSKRGRPIPTKWVFKIKAEGNGNIARYKACLVVCGYRQKFGRDYNLTFAPVSSTCSLHLHGSVSLSLSLSLSRRGSGALSLSIWCLNSISLWRTTWPPSSLLIVINWSWCTQRVCVSITYRKPCAD